MFGKLASMFIEFSVKGVEAVNEAVGGMREQLGDVASTAGSVGNSMAAAFAQAGRSAALGMSEVVRSLGGTPAEARKAADAIEETFADLGEALAREFAAAAATSSANLAGSTRGLGGTPAEARKAAASVADAFNGVGPMMAREFAGATRSLDGVPPESRRAAASVADAFAGIGATMAHRMSEVARAVADSMGEVVADLGLPEAKAKQAARSITQVMRDAFGIMPREAARGAEQTRGYLARLGDTFTVVGKQIGELGRSTGTAFALASGSLLGFVRAGVNSSGLGDVLSYQFAELSRQIAALFLPEIEAVINALQRAINWFRGLSGEQQDQIASWAKWTLIVLGVGPVLTRVAGLAMGAATAFRAVGVALSVAFRVHPILAIGAAIAGIAIKSETLMSVLKGLADRIGMVFDALRTPLAGLLAGIEMVTNAIEGMMEKLGDAMGATGSGPGKKFTLWDAIDPVGWAAGMGVGGGGRIVRKYEEKKSAEREKKEDNKNRRDLLPRIGPFMDLDSAYKQIAQSTMKATAGVKPVDEKQLETLNAINAALAAMWQHVQRLRPLTI